MRKENNTLCSRIPLFPKVRFSKMFTIIKNSINFYNLIFLLFYYIFSNNFSPMELNQFKYFHLMFLKSIKNTLNI